MLSGAAQGALIDFFAPGLTFPIATIGGIIAPFIKIEAKASDTLSYAKDKQKLGYLSSARDYGIIDGNKEV